MPRASARDHNNASITAARLWQHSVIQHEMPLLSVFPKLLSLRFFYLNGPSLKFRRTE
jgi:hypothetical protein